MKRYLKYITAIIAAGAALLSCAKQESDNAFSGREIKFTSSLGTFQVKATDTAFEDGDQIGVFAIGTTQFLNRKLTSDGSALVSETPLYWNDRQGENEYNTFIAYYPYQEGVEDGEENTIFFTVQPDQSTHRGQTASDLMIANTQAAPSDGSVHFNFVHKLSKVLLFIDNQLDSEIADVYLGNLYGRVRAGVDAYGIEPYGDRGTIKAGKVSVNGREAWSLIVVPQNAYPKLMITTVDGKQYTYDVEQEVSFKSARRHTAYVTVNGESISTDFTAEITDWIDDADIQFGQNGGDDPGPGEYGAWAIAGDIPGAYNWDRDLWLDYIEDGTYFGYINYTEGSSFKFRMNGDWNLGDLGCGPVEEITEEPIQLYKGGANITLPQPGLYFIGLDVVNNQMYVEPANFKNCPWSVIGLQGWNKGDDLDMEPDFVQVNGENLPGFKFANMNQYYSKGDEFKFRFSGDWMDDYGLPFDSDPVSAVNTWFPLARGAANIVLGVMPEYYDIIFNWYDRSIMVKTYGDEPQPSVSSIADVLNGEDGVVYTVEARVEFVSNMSYGNMILTDGENELTIYGCKDADGKYPKDYANGAGWYTKSFGYVAGDLIRVTGPRKTYVYSDEEVTENVIELVDVYAEPVELVPVGSHGYAFLLDAKETQFSLVFRTEDIDATSIVPSEDSDWITFDSVKATKYAENGWYSLYLNISPNDSAETREGYVSITCNGYEYPLYLYQPGVSYSSVADVINGQDGVEFTVKGTINSILNIDFGNFYIKDASGDLLYIYGALTEDGKKPKEVTGGWYSKEFGYAIDDEVIVKGVKKTYDGTVELVNVTITPVNLAPVGLINNYLSADGRASEVSLTVRSSGSVIIRAQGGESWIHTGSVTGIDGADGWYTATISLDANPDTENGRSAELIIMSREGNTTMAHIVQGAGVKTMDSLQPIVEGKNGDSFEFSAIVHALTKAGFIVYDGETAVFVYTTTSAAPKCVVGDEVKVSGVKATYQGLSQISNNNLKYEVVSSGNQLFDLPYTEVTSDMMSAQFATAHIPIQATGTLVKNGNYYNVKLNGAEIPFSFYQPVIAPDDLLDQNVVVKGFYNGFANNRTYQGIIATSVEAVTR